MSTPQGPELQLDLPGQQEPELLLVVVTQQGPELYLGVSTHRGGLTLPGRILTTEACAKSVRILTTGA